MHKNKCYIYKENKMPSLNINSTQYDYDDAPDHCPLCHHGIEPIKICHNIIERDQNIGDILQLLYRCPRRECQRAFIASYRQNINHYYHRYDGQFILRNTSPYAATEPEIQKEIKNLSPDYVNLMAQSLSAEHYQLEQISGVGYRKALEYLIKDYAIHKTPEDKETVKSSFLGVVINKPQ